MCGWNVCKYEGDEHQMRIHVHDIFAIICVLLLNAGTYQRLFVNFEYFNHVIAYSEHYDAAMHLKIRVRIQRPPLSMDQI